MPEDGGSQSLELAMTVPVICLLMLLVAAVGQIVVATLGVHQLAAQAARLAAVAEDDRAALGIDRAGATLELTPAPPARRRGDLLRATVSRHVRVVVPWPWTHEVSASAIMRVEDPP